MKKLLSGLAFLLVTGSLFAQVVLPVRFVRVRTIEDDGAVSLTDLDVEVEITGNIATTTMDMIFTSTSSRVLEGEFEFPLGENQTIVGYALDINGKMRDGVVVEKDKGRQVFEDKVRQSVDPGLLEVTQGNNFKTRIYPFNPGGARHVRIIYEEEIKNQYLLNPLTDQKLKNFKLSMNVIKPTDIDIQTAGNNFDLGKWNDGYYVYSKHKDFVFTDPIVIDLPEEPLTKGLYVQNVGKDTYFYTFFPTSAPVRPKTKKSFVSVLFDTSLSAQNRDLNAEINLLKAYINANVKGVLEIRLFSNEEYAVKAFKSSEVEEIENFLKNVNFDGATNLSAVFKNGTENPGKYDEILLFTDGLNTWDSPSFDAKGVPVSIISSSASADYSMMKNFARDNNGIFINLVTKDTEQALKDLLAEPYRLISVDYDKDVISEVYPVAGTVVGNDFSLSGKLDRKEGKVTLGFGYGNEVISTQEFTVSSVTTETSPSNLSRLWAKKKIDELSSNYTKNKQEIIDIAKKFKIVTKDTSLIVLEDVYDYVKYKIEPPEELLNEYERLTAGSNVKLDEEEEKIPVSVIKAFEAFKKWWNTTPEEFKAKAEKEKKKSTNSSLFSRSAPTRREAAESEFDAAPALASTRASAAMDDVAFEEEVSDTAWEGNGFAGNDDSGTDNRRNNNTSISVQAWAPNVEYLAVLKRTAVKDMYSKYLELRKENEKSPSFYMSVSDYFLQEGLMNEAIRIISNLAELELENTDILRAMANKFVDWKMYDRAAVIFEQLKQMRPEVPQFSRDLALAYNELGEYQKAVDELYYVGSRKWDSRYEEIQQIVLNDMNAIIALHPKEVDTKNIDPRVLQNFPVDIRIILTWNTDNCDIDLWTIDPNNEKCYYAHKQTKMGARNSRDFTQGYGPEEFCLRVAEPGKYTIYADYYGTHSQKLLQPVVVQAEVYTNFGKKDQKKEILTLQLETVKGNYLVGTIEIK